MKLLKDILDNYYGIGANIFYILSILDVYNTGGNKYYQLFLVGIGLNILHKLDKK